MTALRTPRQIAMDVFGKTSEREIRNKVEQLRRQAVRHEETGGREGIPFKAIGRKRFYYLEFFAANEFDKSEKVALWLRR